MRERCGWSSAAGGGRLPALPAGVRVRTGTTGGAPASTGAAPTVCAGSRTRFAATGRAPVSVVPDTAVSAPGTAMLT